MCFDYIQVQHTSTTYKYNLHYEIRRLKNVKVYFPAGRRMVLAEKLSASGSDRQLSEVLWKLIELELLALG
jgi:hypothetical protein